MRHRGCIVCGAVITAGRGPKKTCSRKCRRTHASRRALARARRLRSPRPRCPRCEAPVPMVLRREGPRLGAMCTACRAEMKAAARRQRICLECGGSFARRAGTSEVYCSSRCRQARHSRDTSGANGRRRARRYGCAYEPVSRMAVFARDGWRCQVCGRKTPRSLMGTRRANAPELGHRVPIACGGSHTYENVECECHACNTKKGARSSAGQIPIFARPEAIDAR